MNDKQLAELNEQMKHALEMIQNSKSQFNFDFGNIPNMMSGASHNIEGENFQEAIVQVMGAIAQLNNLAEDIMKQQSTSNDKKE